MFQDILHEFGPSFRILSIPGPSTLKSMSEKSRSLYLSTTSCVPSLLDSSQSWRGRMPVVRELVIDTLQKVQSSDYSTVTHRSELQFCVNYQGKVDKTVNSLIVISQLVDSDPNKTAFLTGLRLRIVDDLGFCVPHDLCRDFEPFSESNNQVNLTPKHSFVDLHIGKLDAHTCDRVHQCSIDYGADGLSIPVGDCQKIWLLWPLTSSNLRAIKAIDGQRGRLARLAQQLEGCVVVEDHFSTGNTHSCSVSSRNLHSSRRFLSC